MLWVQVLVEKFRPSHLLLNNSCVQQRPEGARLTHSDMVALAFPIHAPFFPFFSTIIDR